MAMRAFLLGLSCAALTAHAWRSTEEDLLRPPALLYHYGERSVLETDIAAGTVPPAAWTQFILQPKSRWGLPAYRRGLYGCPVSGWGETFASTAKRPWVMKIQVKESCRKAPVFNLAEIPESKDFLAWFRSRPQPEFRSYAAFADACFAQIYQGRRFPTGFASFALEGKLAGNPKCHSLIQRYADPKRFPIAYDSGVQGCWYIRNRDCIERITGSADELVGMNAELPNDIQVRMHVNGTEEYLEVARDLRDEAVRIELLLSALAEAKHLKGADLAKIEAIGREYNQRHYKVRPFPTPDWMKTYPIHEWVMFAPLVAQSLRRCVEQGEKPTRELQAKIRIALEAWRSKKKWESGTLYASADATLLKAERDLSRALTEACPGGVPVLPEGEKAPEAPHDE